MRCERSIKILNSFFFFFVFHAVLCCDEFFLRTKNVMNFKINLKKKSTKSRQFCLHVHVVLLNVKIAPKFFFMGMLVSSSDLRYKKYLNLKL